MSVTCHDFMTNTPSYYKIDKNMQNTFTGSESRPVTLRSSTLPSRSQSDADRRRSLNISHYNALQNAVSNLSRIDDFDLEELGYGFFSDVFKVTHKQTGKIMVLKRNKSTNSKMNILREVQLMNRLSHPNILKFKGVCVHQGQLHALTEFINGGDLDQLVTKKNVVLSWKQRMQLALDVAKGMKYLHSVGIFHRDLSAKNCLVQVTTDKRNKKRYSAIVADLGLAEKIPTTPEEEGRLVVVGTPYIIAPEVLNSKPYNEKADVFSYGLLVCQLIALVSYDPSDLPRSSDFGLARDLFNKMVAGTRNEEQDRNNSFPPPKPFLQLAYDCCEIDPKHRPSFDKIVTSLEDMLSAVSRKKVGRSSSHRARDVANNFYVGSKDSNRRHGTSEEDVTSSWGDERAAPLVAKPPTPRKKPRSLSSSRLSRSFSDISRELLNHAANMVASSSSLPSPVDDVMSEELVYSNPFSAFDHLNGRQIKLTDEPSLALLEMTFDLATSDSLKSSWNTKTNSLKRRRRPKSMYFAESHHLIEHVHHGLVSPRTSPSHEVRSFSTKSVPHSPRISASSVSEESLSDCQECNYQRALHRAAILSPRGNNLTSWWCSRKRSDTKSSVQSERQSLATVVSVLSRSIGGVRRSISLPDLPRINSLFHATEKLVNPDQENKLLHNTYDMKSARSKTFDGISTIDSLQYEATESEADLYKSNSTRSSKSLVFSSDDDVLVDCLTSTDGPNVPQLKETNLILSPSSDAASTPKEEYRNFTDGNHLTNRSTSFSSSSSGCSASGLLTSLQTTEITKQNLISKNSSCLSTYADSTYNSSVDTNRPIPGKDEMSLNLSPPFHSSNRDSGYEDTVIAGENLHSLLSSPRGDASHHSHHHVTWNIPEEIPDASAPSSIPLIESYPLGTCLRDGVKDWNGNDRPGVRTELIGQGPVQ